ncbi:hypothetical protein [Flavobacterium sp.]|uniref:hypothetical protein n=1 Tax=Flavobacterium sp. TaxID=239 RepID=UPI0039E44EE6
MTRLRFYMQTMICLLALSVYAQQPAPNPLHQKMATALQSYFALDRENIHLHLNKNIYLTNDRIWFKGYIVEKKNQPTHNTTNVYLNLLDENGQKVGSQLYFAENGLFDGYFNIPDDIKSGTYFIQAFTNYMNNFAEDESSVYRITLLNTQDKTIGWQQKINYDQIDVQFFPESGVFLAGVSNTIGFRVADCSGLGIALGGIEVIDTKGTVLATTSTDQFGYGRFEVYNAELQRYRIRFKANGVSQERLLPLPSATGFTFSANNCIVQDKVMVKVKTNPATHTSLQTLTLVIQQNGGANFIDLQFPVGVFEQSLAIQRSEVAGGLNAFFLVDSNAKLLAQRVIYDPLDVPQKSLLNIVSKNQDQIKITGASGIRAGTMSISVVPAASVNQSPDKPIQAGMAFDAYLQEPVGHLGYYLRDFNRKKHYELDHVLLTEKPKYDWEQIMTAPPQKKYDSDFGLAVKGIINSDTKKTDIFKINMKSTSLGFDEFTSPDAQNEFIFKNLLAIDSAKIYFLPKDKTGKILGQRMGFQILNNNRRLIKAFVSPVKHCATPIVYESSLPFPKIENSILLDSITIENKKNKLKYRNRMGNMTARGYKVTDADAPKSLLGYIGANGFSVSRAEGSVMIYSQMGIPGTTTSPQVSRTETVRRTNGYGLGGSVMVRTSGGGVTGGSPARSPVVFIDDVMVSNFDVLENYTLARIDEIYLNKHSNDVSVGGSSGVIKVYTKQGSSYEVSPTGSPALVIKNGFQRHTPFQNPKYDNVREEGFQKLGTIFWNPMIDTDENGSFSFSIPNLYQKSVCVVMEGMDADGNMISETHLLEIP